MQFSDPDGWAGAVRQSGYSAAYCPVGADADAATVKAYARAAKKSDIAIAEVGAWSNPLSPDAETASKAVEHCKRQLDLADRIGANCCVNISGSRGEQWDGPHPANLTKDTFDRIVAIVREIIDDVKPKRSCYSLETMPWMYPDSARSYCDLIKAVDRERFAVHFDPVNLVCSPQIYFSTGKMIRDFVKRLGPRIKSCHAKDILLSGRLTTHLDETRPGLGGLDYAAFLKALHGLDPDVPLMMEHLAKEEEYAQSAQHIRAVAVKVGVKIL